MLCTLHVSTNWYQHLVILSSHPWKSAQSQCLVKLYSNERLPWNELHTTDRVHSWALRSTASSTMHIWSLCYTSPKAIMWLLFIDWLTNPICTCSQWHVVVQSVVCCQNLASKLLVDLIKCFKGIVSVLTWHGHSSWLNVEALERMPTPLFGRPVSVCCILYGVELGNKAISGLQS